MRKKLKKYKNKKLKTNKKNYKILYKICVYLTQKI